MVQIYLDGVACTFKTTVLTTLATLLNINVNNEDYFEHSRDHEAYRRKENDRLQLILYQIMVDKTLNQDAVFYNRTPLSSYLYEIIQQIMYSELEDKKIIVSRELDGIQQKLKCLFRSWNVLVVLTENIDGTKDRMRNRNNEIDICTTNYVETQNLVFKMAADLFKWETIVVNDVSDIPKLEKKLMEMYHKNLKNIIHSSIPLLSKSYPTDAGIDLRSRKKTTIPARTFMGVSLKEKFCIPKGYFGLICPRSSSKYLVNVGVYDSGYIGQGVVNVFNCMDNSIILEEDQKICQLVLLPVTNMVNVVTNLNTLQVERGTNGLGSSGNF